jgi:hypothetical protein
VRGVGVDWTESFHDVALGRPGEGPPTGWVGAGTILSCFLTAT